MIDTNFYTTFITSVWETYESLLVLKFVHCKKYCSRVFRKRLLSIHRYLLREFLKHKSLDNYLRKIISHIKYTSANKRICICICICCGEK